MQGDLEAHIVEDREPQTSSTMEVSRKYLIIYALGIFICYFVYGVLQEEITQASYKDGDHTEKFTYTLSLVFVQCLINLAFAKIVLFTTERGLDTTPTYMYAACAVTYLGAMLASNHSLLHVSYPTQVIGKSIKPIPVMVLGVLLGRKRYPLQKYLFVLMIVIGVALFIYKDQKPSAASSGFTFGFGEFLLVVSLALDGLTGGIQDKIRGTYKTLAHTMMASMNWVSALILLVALVVTGEGLTFVSFVQRHPYVMVNMLLFSISSALGQNFIFLMVTSFGPLMCSITTTTRKFFTLLGSVLIFGNNLQSRQWVGTGLVFAGLILDSAYGKEAKKGAAKIPSKIKAQKE